MGLDQIKLITEIPLGIEWNNGKTNGPGNPRTSTVGVRSDRLVQTTSRDVRQTRTGVRTRMVPQTVRQSLGDRVVGVGFVPFIRSRNVEFAGCGLRPIQEFTLSLIILMYQFM